MPTENQLARDVRPSRDQVLDGVRKIVGEQMGMPPENIRETDALEADLGCDSLDVVEIAMEVEEHFGIDVPEDLGEGARTVGQIADGVMQLLIADG
jgi:acyl carrier protein